MKIKLKKLLLSLQNHNIEETELTNQSNPIFEEKLKNIGWNERKIYRADNDFVSNITLMNKNITLGGDITKEYIIKDVDVNEINKIIELLEDYFSKGSLMPKSTKSRHTALVEEAEIQRSWENSIMSGLRYVGTKKLINY